MPMSVPSSRPRPSSSSPRARSGIPVAKRRQRPRPRSLRWRGDGASSRASAQVEVETYRARHVGIRGVLDLERTDESDVGAPVAVVVADPHETDVARLLLERHREIRLRRVLAAGLAPVDGDLLAAPQMDEVGAAVPVEVPGELGEAPQLEVVESMRRVSERSSPVTGVKTPSGP